MSLIPVTPTDVLKFWLEDTGPEGWYKQSDALDAEVRARFLDTWQAAHDANTPPWSETAEDALASAILLDQFPRNMFRDDPRAYSTDALAVDHVRKAIARRDPAQIDGNGRQFFFLPFTHSEDLAEKDEGIRYLETYMPGSLPLLHARAHRQVIADFGRFPFRNEALGRESTPAELKYMEEGGYGAIVRALQAAENG